MRRNARHFVVLGLMWMLIASMTPVSAAPLLPNVDLLNVSVRTVYPPEVKKVRDAVEWLMQPLGYYVITEYPAPTSAKALLARDIPPSAKMHRTMPVTHALQLLIGQDNTIIVDKQHRLITFGRGHSNE